MTEPTLTVDPDDPRSLAGALDRSLSTIATPLIARLCDLAETRAGDRVLDVGCGTGVASREAARRVVPSGHVLGIDPDPQRILFATESIVPALRGSLEFRTLEPHASRLADQTFDVAISFASLLHLERREKVLNEIYRTLKPGGRIVVAFGAARPASTGSIVRHVVREAVSEVESLWQPRMKAPDAILSALSVAGLLGDSQMRHSDFAPAVLHEIETAGFDEIATHWEDHHARFDSPEEFWDAQVAIASDAQETVRANRDAIGPVRDRFLHDAREVLGKGGELVYPFGAIFIAARRPNVEGARYLGGVRIE